MELTDQQCYNALKSRDFRFDGRFFVGVHSTGIYCRPVCPAKTPLRKNVRFYRHALQAEDAGLRPCLRCRPETAPGTPAWNGTSTTVTRAHRLISEGLAEEWTITDLASRLGVTDRHLRRLFSEHFGASPIAVMQQHRVQLAKQLLSETTLPITQIAFASGFKSVRRFNHRFKETYRQPPQAIRRRKEAGEGAAEGLTVRLAYRPPYDWDHVMSYLQGRAIRGVESISDDHYSRVIRFSDVTGIIQITPEPDAHRIAVQMEPQLLPHLPQIVSRARRLFDLQCDPSTIRAALGQDKALSALVKRRPGLRLPGAWCPFELGVRAILGQQVSVKGATTLSGRLIDKYGESISTSEGAGLTHAFPTPQRLSRARVETIGMPKARGAAIRNFAQAVASGEVPLHAHAEAGKVVESLCALPGIGPWTAQYIVMRGLSEPDAFPIDDLGLIQALENIEGTRIKGKVLLERAEAWRPWRAYATLHLWSSLSDPEPKRKKK